MNAVFYADRRLMPDRLRGDRGATAVEYGLIAVAVAGVIVVTVTAIGLDTLALFTSVPNALDAVGAGD